MLELLMLSLCFGSEMSNDACQNAYEKWIKENPSVEEQMKMYQRSYEKKLPVELIWAGSAAGFIYKKDIKLGLSKSFYVEVRDQGYGGFGFKKDFP